MLRELEAEYGGAAAAFCFTWPQDNIEEASTPHYSGNCRGKRVREDIGRKSDGKKSKHHKRTVAQLLEAGLKR